MKITDEDMLRFLLSLNLTGNNVAQTNVTFNESLFDLILTRDGSDSDARNSRGAVGNSMPIRLLFYIVYALIFSIGIMGNLLVCFVVARNTAMQNVTNFFIANLAVSDILICVLAVPFTSAHIALGTWLFGETLCHIVPFAQGVSVYVSAFTLMAIAVDRYFVIIHPFRSRMQVPLCAAIVACIWLTACMFTLPYGTFIEHFHVVDGTFCQENWPAEHNRRTFSLLTTFLQFVLPFAVVSFCYLRVCCKLRQRVRVKSGAKSLRELERKRTRRTNRMLIVMVMFFAASWLPLNIHNLWIDFHIPAAAYSASSYNVIFFTCHAVAMSSTCYNPFLYAWLNDNFRKEFKQVLPGFRIATPAPSVRRSNSQAKPERAQNGTGQVDMTVQETFLPKSSNFELSSNNMPALITVRYSTTGPDQILLTVPAPSQIQS